MATWGITSSGFYCPTLQEVITYNLELRATELGIPTPAENSLIGMQSKVTSLAEFKMWQQLQSTYLSQTKAGAEGIFKDEMYGFLGTIRKGATSSTGEVIVEVGEGASDTTSILKDSTVSSEDHTYTTDTSVMVRDKVRAYKIQGVTLVAGTYGFSITNSSGTNTTGSFVLTSDSDADRKAFFDNLKTLFDTALPSDTASVFVDESVSGDYGFYVGFSSNKLVTGTTNTFKLEFTSLTSIGNRYTEVSVTATETGSKVLAPYKIKDILPTPTDYKSVTNLTSFNSGTDVESDASYTYRAEQRSDSPQSSTRPAIISRMLGVADVRAFVLDKQISVGGVVTLTPIVLGGVTEDIATTLYQTQAGNNSYEGVISHAVATEDGSTETIRFTRAQELERSVRITYNPIDNTNLSDSEKTSILKAIDNLVGGTTIGETEFNSVIKGAVFNTNPKRFRTLSVETKNTTGGTWSDQDFIPQPQQIPTLSSTRVEFVRV